MMTRSNPPKRRRAFAMLLAGFFLASFCFLARPIETSGTRSPSGAMQALDFFAAARAYPNATIPAQGHYRAFEYSKSNLQKKNAALRATEPWQLLGPKNVGGRTNAIAFNPLNPNTIYVGAASGGLWRSYTGGVGVEAWEYVDTGFPVLGVGAIAIDPLDSNVIYIGTGEVYGYQNSLGGVTVRTTRGSYGIGILKTIDGGATWSKSLDWTQEQQRGVQALALNPTNSSIIYAGTTEGTYKSMNAGASWTLVHNVPMAMDIDLNPLDPNIVFVACGDLGSPGAAVYRSKDAGATWQKLTNGLPANYTGKTILDIHPLEPNIIYAHVANDFNSLGIYRSTDSGDTWERRSSLDIAQYQGWYSHFVIVHPFDPETVIAGGIDLWKSVDGGRTFTRKSNWAAWQFGVVPIGGPEGPPNYSHADHHAAMYHPIDPDIVYFTNDGGVFRSRDNGETFEGVNGGYASTQFYNGFSCAWNDSNLAIGGLQDNSTVIYEGAAAWRRVIGGDGCWTAIDQQNHNVMYGEAQQLNIFKSLQRGHESSWFGVAGGIPTRNNASFVAPYIVSPFDPQTLYAGTNRVYKSTNAAGSWTATNGGRVLDNNPLVSLAMSATNTDTVYAGTSPITTRAHVFRTINGGLTWDDVTGALPDRYPMDIAVDPNDSRKVYVVFSGFGASHLFKSHDAGWTWIDIGAGLPDVPSSAVTVDPLFPEHIYFGNDLGVYVSVNGGGSWQEWREGLPSAVLVMDLTISPSNRKLRVATHGNGVWERTLLEAPDVSVHEPPQNIVSFRLEQNYPNPFSLQRGERTTIAYELENASAVQLVVYNMMGQEVARLQDGMVSAGRHSVRFEGKKLAAGAYFYRLRVGEAMLMRKMLVVE